MIRMSTTLTGLRLANVFDLSMFSLLEDASGNQLLDFVLGNSQLIIR